MCILYFAEWDQLPFKTVILILLIYTPLQNSVSISPQYYLLLMLPAILVLANLMGREMVSQCFVSFFLIVVRNT